MVVPFTEAPKAEGRERHIYNKGVYCALCLTHRNLAHFWYSQEHGNSGCPTGCVMSHPFCWCTPVCQWIGVTFISGVGFRVARSTVPGNARASMRGTSDGENSHAFLYVYVNQKYCLICSFGSCGHLHEKDMKKIFFDSFAYWALQPFKYRWLKKIENHRDNRNSTTSLPIFLTSSWHDTSCSLQQSAY